MWCRGGVWCGGTVGGCWGGVGGGGSVGGVFGGSFVGWRGYLVVLVLCCYLRCDCDSVDLGGRVRWVGVGSWGGGVGLGEVRGAKGPRL